MEQQTDLHRLDYHTIDSGASPSPQPAPVVSAGLALIYGVVATGIALAVLLGTWRRNEDVVWVGLVVFTLPAFFHSLDCLSHSPSRRLARWAAGLCTFPVIVGTGAFVYRLTR